MLQNNLFSLSCIVETLAGLRILMYHLFQAVLFYFLTICPLFIEFLLESDD